MKHKLMLLTTALMPRLQLVCLLLLTGLMALTGCKKDQLTQPAAPDESQIAQLLQLPADAGPALLSTTDHLRNQLLQKDYSADFLRRHGLPLWGKAIQTGDGAGDFMLYVPTQLPGQSEPSGFFAVRRRSGQFGYRLFARADVEAGATGLPQWQPVFWLARLEAKAFDRTVRFAPLWPQALAKAQGQRSQGNYFAVIKPRPNNSTARSNDDGEDCCIEIWYNPDGDAGNNNGDEYYLHDDCSGCANTLEDVGDWTNGLGDAGNGGGGGSGGGGQTPPVDYGYIASQIIPLSDVEQTWLLANPLEAKQVELYLRNSARPEKNIIAAEHVARASADTGYMSFVKNHTVTGNPLSVWWEDDAWLDDPNHFALNASYDQQYGKLKAAEKQLVAAYPVQAAITHSNIQPSFDMATREMGLGTNNGLNDKKDAFRHAYFNAINTRDVTPRLFPTYMPAHAIVKLFADAHETETPPQLQLEAQMDVFNNYVGIGYCLNCFPGLHIDNQIAGEIKFMLNQGQLRYLSPLDPFNYPPYNPNNPNCTNCTNGIIPGVTVLTPTNQ
jgi:hypothetical protein